MKVKILKAPGQDILVGQEGRVIDKRKDTEESCVLLSDGKYVWVKNEHLNQTQ